MRSQGTRTRTSTRMQAQADPPDACRRKQTRADTSTRMQAQADAERHRHAHADAYQCVHAQARACSTGQCLEAQTRACTGQANARHKHADTCQCLQAHALADTCRCLQAHALVATCRCLHGVTTLGPPSRRHAHMPHVNPSTLTRITYFRQLVLLLHPLLHARLPVDGDGGGAEVTPTHVACD